MHRRLALVLAGLALGSSPLAAQQTPPPAPPAPTITPQNGQSSEQAELDKAQCTNAATQASGFVPGTPPPAQAAPQGPSGQRLRGAARGAAAGAVVGEVQGDRYDNAPDELRDEHTQNQAATGAAVGAVAGGSRARRDRRQAAAQQKSAAEQYAETKAAWDSSFAGCLQQRGYTVAQAS